MSETRAKEDRREPIRVVDRRGFTPEGQPRTPDLIQDDPPAPPPAPAHRDASGVRPQTPDEGRDATQSGEDRLASSHFKNLVLNLATSAAAGLGEIPNPYSQRTEIDLEGARHVIDLLQALRLKTRGNLTSEESTLIENLIYDLQMKYVALQSRPPGTS